LLLDTSPLTPLVPLPQVTAPALDAVSFLHLSLRTT
jgi:hypothetical protein